MNQTERHKTLTVPPVHHLAACDSGCSLSVMDGRQQPYWPVLLALLCCRIASCRFGMKSWEDGRRLCIITRLWHSGPISCSSSFGLSPLDRPVAGTTSLNPVAVDTRCLIAGHLPVACLLLPVEVDIFDVECMDVARNVTEERQADIDEEVGTAACYSIYTDGRDCDSVISQVHNNDRPGFHVAQMSGH